MNGLSLATVEDTAPGVNLMPASSPFGHCSRLNQPCQPQVAKVWSRAAQLLVWSPAHKKNTYPLPATALLPCANGGLIAIKDPMVSYLLMPDKGNGPGLSMEIVDRLGWDGAFALLTKYQRAWVSQIDPNVNGTWEACGLAVVASLLGVRHKDVDGATWFDQYVKDNGAPQRGMTLDELGLLLTQTGLAPAPPSHMTSLPTTESPWILELDREAPWSQGKVQGAPYYYLPDQQSAAYTFHYVAVLGQTQDSHGNLLYVVNDPMAGGVILVTHDQLLDAMTGPKTSVITLGK
jgi:hypothetical protein